MDDCNQLIRERLVQEFSRGVRIDESQGDCRIIFPFTRTDGDPIILYVIDKGDHYIVTDDGETHGMLLVSGVDIDTKKRQNRVDAAKERFNLDEASKEIRLTSSHDDLGGRILDAYQAVQWIAFLVYTRQPYSPSYFRDKVASFLRENEYNFDEDVDVPAESESRNVDFEITGLSQPTYLESIQARNGSDLHGKSDETSLKWIKIGRAQPNSRFITVVDDVDGVYKKANMKSLFDDSDAIIPWTEKDDLINVLG